MTGSWKGRGNQYIQFVRVLYCKLPTNDRPFLEVDSWVQGSQYIVEMGQASWITVVWSTLCPSGSSSM